MITIYCTPSKTFPLCSHVDILWRILCPLLNFASFLELTNDLLPLLYYGQVVARFALFSGWAYTVAEIPNLVTTVFPPSLAYSMLHMHEFLVAFELCYSICCTLLAIILAVFGVVWE